MSVSFEPIHLEFLEIRIFGPLTSHASLVATKLSVNMAIMREFYLQATFSKFQHTPPRILGNFRKNEFFAKYFSGYSRICRHLKLKFNNVSILMLEISLDALLAS